jgi:mannosyltransferase OCH1-like enzyme
VNESRFSARTPRGAKSGGMVELSDFSAKSPLKGLIPPFLYQTAPSRKVHPIHKERIERFRESNSGLYHVLFDQPATDEYMESSWSGHPIKDLYDTALYGPMKADIFRYCLIFERGGFYLDITKAFSKPLSFFVNSSSEGLIGFEEMNAAFFPELQVAKRLRHPECDLIQWCFGFKPNHPILELAIDRVVYAAKFFAGEAWSVRQAIFAATGPGVFTWAVREYFREYEGENVAQAPQLFGETEHLRIPHANDVFQGAPHYASQFNTPIYGEVKDAKKGGRYGS